MSISDRLDEIQARADNATEGPWEAYEDVRVPGISHIKVPGSMHSTAWPENAEFIAHARTDVPAMLDALRAVLDACSTYEKTQAIYGIEMGQREIIRVIRSEIAAALGEGS